MMWVATVLSAAGFWCLALAMQRHAVALVGRPPEPRMRLVARVAGAVLLSASLAASCTAWGIAWGLVGWWGVLTVGAAGVLAVLTLRAGRASRPKP